MTDIVERLRVDNEGCGTRMDEAADEIESLRHKIVNLDKENLELHLAATHSERELREERKKLASCLANKWKARCEKAEQQLAECQTREKVLRDRLRWHIRVYRVADEAWDPEAECDRLMEKEVGLPSDSTALDTMLKQAKRKALIEAANRFLGESHRENTGEKRKAIYLSAAGWLRRMAEELK